MIDGVGSGGGVESSVDRREAQVRLHLKSNGWIGENTHLYSA